MLNKRAEANTIAIIAVGAVLALGAVMESKGLWGADGKYAVKNCPGHVDGNCAGLKLDDLGTGVSARIEQSQRDAYREGRDILDEIDTTTDRERWVLLDELTIQ